MFPFYPVLPRIKHVSWTYTCIVCAHPIAVFFFFLSPFHLSSQNLCLKCSLCGILCNKGVLLVFVFLFSDLVWSSIQRIYDIIFIASQFSLLSMKELVLFAGLFFITYGAIELLTVFFPKVCLLLSIIHVSSGWHQSNFRMPNWTLELIVCYSTKNWINNTIILNIEEKKNKISSQIFTLHCLSAVSCDACHEEIRSAQCIWHKKNSHTCITTFELVSEQLGLSLVYRNYIPLITYLDLYCEG